MSNSPVPEQGQLVEVRRRQYVVTEIEAGLVMQELIVRNRACTVLIVCPSALQVQYIV